MPMKKSVFKCHAASVMRQAAVCALMLCAASAYANDGDHWEAPAAQPNMYSNYADDVLDCYFEVVSEADATVKYIPRSTESNTLGPYSDVTGGFWLADEVIHNGKSYRVVGIGTYAFRGMPYVQEISLMGKYSEEIGNMAFYECPELVSVNLPEGLKRIGSAAFQLCSRLHCTTDNGHDDAAFILPLTLENLGTYAFGNCNSLENVVFPNGLKTIGSGAFFSCYGLTSVELPSSMENVEGNPFSLCKNLSAISVRRIDGPVNFFSFNDVFFAYNEDGSRRLVSYPCAMNQEYTIPDFTEEIGRSAFYGSKLSKLTIPQTVMKIGTYAFGLMDNLESVYLEWTSELPECGNDPFYTYEGTYNAYFYVPKVGANVNEQDIAQMYMYSDWYDWCKNIRTYDVGIINGLIIAGWHVKRTMAKNITFPEIASGKISYDLVSSTLTLDNVLIETTMNDEFAVGNEGIFGMTIKLIGSNKFDTNSRCFYADSPTVIEGSGSLTAISNYEEAIYLEDWGDLYVNDCTLDLDSRGGAIKGDGNACVYVTNSNITMWPTGATGVATMDGIMSFEMDNCFISAPTFGEFDPYQKTVVNYEGDPWYGYILVKPGMFYNFYVESTPVTNLNCDDIPVDGLREGWVAYDPDDNTLTLNNVNFFSNNSFLLNNNDYLYMELVGDNYINTTEDCLWLLEDMYILGDGTLVTDADMGVAVKIERPWVWLYLWDTDVNLRGVGGAVYGKSDCEQQGMQIYKSHVKMSSNGNYKVTDCLNSFKLEDCQFVHGYFYFDEDEGYICDERFFGDPVYQDEIEIIPSNPTAINNVVYDATQPRPAETIYDLQGRRINGKPQKGIYIKDGKKLLSK